MSRSNPAFAPFTLKNLNLSNRFVRSSTHEGHANHGAVTDPYVAIYEKLAKGHLGLILSSHLAVTKQGHAAPSQLSIESDDKITGLKRIVDVCHANGTPIVAQINHSGVKGNPSYTGHPVLNIDTMTAQDFQGAVDAYGEAARRARAAGFDGIQIHCAHGYFLSQVLSPQFNHRTDEYGASAEGRAKLVIDIYRRVRSVVGADVAVLVKINTQDFNVPAAPADNVGQTIADTIAVTRLLQAEGVDAIELSGGVDRNTFSRRGVGPENDGYHFEYARQLRAAGVSVPLLLVGGIRSLASANRFLASGACDLVSLSRPLICEPDLVKKMELEGVDTARCVSCNACFPLPNAGIECRNPKARVAH